MPDPARAVEEAAAGRPGSRAARLADRLPAESPEFAALWGEHQVGVGLDEVKRFVHPDLGMLELSCQRLIDPDQGHSLLVYTASPGSESHERLRLLAAVVPS